MRRFFLKILQYFLFVLVLSSFTHSECLSPYDFSDPDVRMDHIGEDTHCQKYDLHSTLKQRFTGQREDLGGGIVISDYAANSDGARSIKIIGNYYYVIGRINNGTNDDFGIMRYFLDGSIDTSFDTDGKMIHSFGGGSDVAYVVVPQNDLKIIVIGRTDAGVANAYNFALLRLNTNGSLDTSFSTDGKNTADVSGGADFARAAQLASDGSIVVAGYGDVSNNQFALGRFATNGNLDTAFSTTGKLSVNVAGSDNAAFGLEIITDGRIVAAGAAGIGPTWDFASIRVLTSGNLDTTFYTTGKRVFSIQSKDDLAYAVVKGANETVSLVGASHNGTNLDFAIARLLSNGALDTTFDTDGKKIQSILSGNDAAYSAALQTDGVTLYAVGYAYNGANNDFAIARFLSNGSLDADFGGGRLTYPIGAAEDTAQSLFTFGDSVLLLAGRTWNGADLDFAFLRLQTNGTLAVSGIDVPGLAFNGYDSGVNDEDVPYGITATSSGYIYLAGYVTTAGLKHFNLMRIAPDGTRTLNQTNNIFGTDQKLKSITIDSSGKLITCGNYTGNFIFKRYLTTGSLDTTFHTTGYKSIGSGYPCVTVSWSASDNSYEGSGSSTAQRAGGSHIIIKLQSNGAFDTSFRTSGILTLSPPTTNNGGGSTITASGSHVLITAIDTAAGYTAIQRVNYQTGLLDTTFNTTGTFNNLIDDGVRILPNTNDMDPGQNIAVDNEGRSYVSFTHSVDPVHRVARFNTDGTLDTSFSTVGVKIVQNARAGGAPLSNNILLQPNGKAVRTSYSANVWNLVRLNTDGSYDTTFTEDGQVVPNARRAAISGNQNSITFTPQGWICSTGSESNDFALNCVWQ